MNDFFTFSETNKKDSQLKEQTKKKGKRVSWSQYKIFEKCPHQWQLQYRDGNYLPGDTIHTIFGTAVHEAIQTYLTVMYRNSVKAADQVDMEEILVNVMRQEFQKAKEALEDHELMPNDQDPATYVEMKKFLMDGKNILKSFRSKRRLYFNSQDTELVGIELQVSEEFDNGVTYIGYLDVVLYDKLADKYRIIDLKTSTKGWSKWDKKDKMKVNQLISYKNYYARQLGVDPDKIDVEYLILKRELYEDVEWPQKRIQTFSPPNGSITQNEVQKGIDEFVHKAFDDNGTPRQGEFEKNPEKYKCAFCPFSAQWGQLPICDQGGKRWTRDDYSDGMQKYLKENHEVKDRLRGKVDIVED